MTKVRIPGSTVQVMMAIGVIALAEQRSTRGIITHRDGTDRCTVLVTAAPDPELRQAEERRIP
ncbi:MAG: hypothetical protein EOO66_00490 [Methylobacterium sp.]|nr:MAG: hypothetical protein EOO66_00490 [Methylobacterium sp.]